MIRKPTKVGFVPKSPIICTPVASLWRQSKPCRLSPAVVRKPYPDSELKHQLLVAPFPILASKQAFIKGRRSGFFVSHAVLNQDLGNMALRFKSL